MSQSEAPALHVYEQVVPVQLAEDAFVAVHTSPQALQFWVVLSSVHVEPQVVSVHVHEPLEQLGVGWAHVARFVHVPVLLHVCGVLPLQFVWPGAQTPEQTPPAHVCAGLLVVQFVALPQVPLAVHE